MGRENRARPRDVHDPGKSPSETFIFRKFDRLSARRLLHLQSQNIDLEDELDGLDAAARRGDAVSQQALLSHKVFAERSAKDPTSIERKRWILLDTIHGKLNQYHETLLLQSHIENLERPRQRALSTYRSYLQGKSAKPEDKILFGKAQHLLDSDDDLVALKTPSDIDPMSRFLQDYWPGAGTPNSYDPGGTTVYYQEKRIQRVVAIVNVIIAAILIVGAIVSLHHVEHDQARLGMIGGFTVLFALSLGLLTSAKRVEIFAATAAYAAVLVVFVSSELGGNNRRLE